MACIYFFFLLPCINFVFHRPFISGRLLCFCKSKLFDMSPSGPSNGTTKDPREGRKHGELGFQKHGKHDKNAASENDNEDAPLLADDSPNEDIEASTLKEPGHLSTKREQTKRFLQNVGHWTWSNKVILALVLLLIGGIVAVVVYFTGMFVLCNLLLLSLRSCSR